MPLPQLMAIPATPPELAGWEFANMASHRDIIRRVKQLFNVELIEYPLEPFNPEDPANLEEFLNNNQNMHAQMNLALGIASSNLSEVDWQNPSDLARWVFQHAQEHRQASQLLRIS